MSYYNYNHLIKQMVNGVFQKLKSPEYNNNVTAVCTHSYDDTIALAVTVNNIGLSVPGFVPNRADYIIEIWYKGSVFEKGKLVSCGDTYSLCWDEIDGLIEWYVKDTFDTTNDRKRVVEIEGEYDLGLSYGKRELGRQMRPLIMEKLGVEGIRQIAHYAINNCDLENVDFSHHV
ncbi:hypothetical protein [uncultured Psychrobacter sp.]|uniref:hypothetical protein n=1 Tax=uncultured Psychrobacter sp. TaxID=259303 RepID=UPI0030DD5B2D